MSTRHTYSDSNCDSDPESTFSPTHSHSHSHSHYHSPSTSHNDPLPDITFLDACEYGQLQNVQEILQKRHFDIHVTNADHENALMVAAAQSHHHIVKSLLHTDEYDIWAKNKYHESTLMIAAFRKHSYSDNTRQHRRIKTCRLIIDHMKKKYNKNEKSKKTNILPQSTPIPSFHDFNLDVLYEACTHDSLDILKALIDTQHINLATKDKHDSTLLVYASSPRIVREITKHHTYTKEEIQKALWSAYRHRRPEVMECLILEYDADAYRPQTDPTHVFTFRDSLLPDILEHLSITSDKHDKMKKQVKQLLHMSHQTKQ